MILRIIVSTVVLILFSIPLISTIRKEYRENNRVSKWSVFFLVLAVLLWLAVVISFFAYIMSEYDEVPGKMRGTSSLIRVLFAGFTDFAYCKYGVRNLFRCDSVAQVGECVFRICCELADLHKVFEACVFKVHLFECRRHTDVFIEFDIPVQRFIRTVFKDELYECAISDFLTVGQVMDVAGE